MSINSLAPWYGSDRTIVSHIGEALRGCEHVSIPFSGGASAVLAIKARTIVCNDLHRHVVNLCRVVASPELKDWLVDRLRKCLFHPDVLDEAQEQCLMLQERGDDPRTVADSVACDWAAAYFVCVWMGRSGVAGTPSEFTGGLALRFNAGGGDSNVRFRSAIDALETFHRAMVDRCTFSTLGAFEFLDKCHDKPGHGIYADPPFIGPGAGYTHNAGKGKDEADWHWKLATRLRQFAMTRVVVRAYDVPLVRDLYTGWEFRELAGRDQTNAAKLELLIVRNGGAT